MSTLPEWYLCLWPQVFLGQGALAVFTTSGQVAPSKSWAWLSWWHSCRQVWAGFKPAHLNLTLPCQLLNFQASGWEGRWDSCPEIWACSAFVRGWCVLQKKGLWMKGLWTSLGCWKPLATNMCLCGSLSEREPPATSHQCSLVSRMLGFFSLKCNLACSHYIDVSAVL